LNEGEIMSKDPYDLEQMAKRLGKGGSQGSKRSVHPLVVNPYDLGYVARLKRWLKGRWPHRH